MTIDIFHTRQVREDRYTHGHGDAVLRSHRWRTVENSAAYLVSSLRPGMRLLDVGCGPGNLTLDLAGRVAPGRVDAIDASPDAIELAAADDPERQVTWRVADVYALPFEDSTVDVVHAHQVLQHLGDPVAALREMGRVVAPGGIVAARDADFSAFSWYPIEPALDRWRDVYDTVARANGGEPNGGRHLESWAKSAGFVDVIISTSTWRFETPEERTWWSELWAERTTDSPLATRAIELGIADAAELRGLAAAWRRWSADPDAWFLVPHGEIICRADSTAT